MPSYPFPQLWQIIAQARIFLEGLSVDDIRSVEQDLDVAIFDTKTGLAEHCLDHHVEQVLKEGSWELGYQPADTDPTPQNVKRLLENWPADAVEVDYIKEDDYSDVEAPQTVVSWGGLGTVDSDYNYPVHCAAVLALMKAADCLDTLQCPEADLGTCEDGPVSARLINADNYAVEAAQAVGYASEIAEVIKMKLKLLKTLKRLTRKNTSNLVWRVQKKLQPCGMNTVNPLSNLCDLNGKSIRTPTTLTKQTLPARMLSLAATDIAIDAAILLKSRLRLLRMFDEPRLLANRPECHQPGDDFFPH